MNKIFCSLLVLGFGLACAPQPNAIEGESKAFLVDEKVQSRIDSALKALVDEGRVAGVSALIYEKNKEVYSNAFGYSDREQKVPMDRNTIVRIYSMTKPITGVALMTLYEKGAFQLDDPIEKFAPEFANMNVLKKVDASGNLVLEPARRPITIRDLTRHTAGFPNQNDSVLGSLWRRVEPLSQTNTLSEMAGKLADLPLKFHPGDEWAYGPSVDVQAFLVERISGKPYDQYLKENVLDPLGMANTRYYVPEIDRRKLAANYRRGENGALTRIPDEEANASYIKEWPLKAGGSGLTSTLDDYMRFARMLVNEGKLDDVTILKEETVKLMATNHLPDRISKRMWLPSKGQVGFGIDFAVRLRRPATADENNCVVGEFFWDGAASTLFWVDPLNELTAVLFVQVMPFDRQVHKRFRDAVYGLYKPG